MLKGVAGSCKFVQLQRFFIHGSALIVHCHEDIFAIVEVAKYHGAAQKIAHTVHGSLTDLADGYIARNCNQVSDFGKFLDPLADKLMVIGAMTIFCQWGLLPAWALMIVLTREFAVTGLRLVAVGKGTVIAAGWSGKVKTASTIICLCIWMAFPTSQMIGWIATAVIIATTVYSGVEYFMQNRKCLWQ